MDSIEISISFIVAMVGVAYPILLQVILRLDESYSSTGIVRLFKEEPGYRWFKVSLYISLLLFFVYIVTLSIWGEPHNLLGDSLEILMVLMTISLILSFFVFLNKMLVYYEKYELTSYLIRKDRESGREEDRYFLILTEFLLKSIREQDERVSKSINSHFYICFKNYREYQGEEEVVYPSFYYRAVYRVTHEILKAENDSLRSLSVELPAGKWLLGDSAKNKISEETYKWMWLTLRLVENYKRDDVLMLYWRRAFQYFLFSLPPIDPEYTPDYRERKNESAIREREDQRNVFLRFNLVFGALLFNQSRNALLRRMFYYTNSQPPSYRLFPQSLTAVFEEFLWFRKLHVDDPSYLSLRYNFPEINIIDADDQILYWICKYTALLFLRQFTLNPVYIYDKTNFVLQMPSDYVQKKKWLDNIDLFEKLIVDIYSDADVMQEVGYNTYDSISEEWCQKKGLTPPLIQIRQIRDELTASCAKDKLDKPLSTNKITDFIANTNTVFSAFAAELSVIQNSKRILFCYDSSLWGVQRAISDKESFLEDEKVFCDLEMSVAYAYVLEIKQDIVSHLCLKKSKTYIVRESDFFNSLARLTNACSGYVVIACNVDFDKLASKYGAEKRDYEVWAVKRCYNLVENSLFILRKEDLPNIIFNKVEQDDIQSYDLKLINEKINLYAGVVEIGKSEVLLRQYEHQLSEEELRFNVLEVIGINMEFRCKKKVNIIQFEIASLYEKEELINSISDIEPWK